MNFEFYLPVEVIFGTGSVERVGEIGRRFGYRALVVTGKKAQRKTKLLQGH